MNLKIKIMLSVKYAGSELEKIRAPHSWGFFLLWDDG